MNGISNLIRVNFRGGIAEKEADMRRTAFVRALTLAVGITVAGIGDQSPMAPWPGDLFAQEVGQTRELSPGRVRKNLGEGPANVPGFEKVRIVEDTAQPGAGWSTPPTGMPYPMFCTLLKGEITTVMGGVETKRKAGDSWVCEVGQKVDAKSTGSEPSMMRMHFLLKAGEK